MANKTKSKVQGPKPKAAPDIDLPAHITTSDKLMVFTALKTFEDITSPSWKPFAANARAAFNRIAATTGGGK